MMTRLGQLTEPHLASLRKFGIDRAGQRLCNDPGVPLQCLRLHGLLCVEQSAALLTVGARQAAGCERWLPPDGESLVFPGELVVSEVDLLVDHLHLRLVVKGLRHGD